MQQLSNIVYEQGVYYVIKAPHAYEIYKSGITRAVRCATVGDYPIPGLALTKVKAEIARRIKKDEGIL